MSEQNHRIYEFGPFRLDARKRMLLRDGEPVKLFPKEFDTLLALVERSGEELDKDELMRQVWGEVIVEEGNLAKNVSALRKLLGEKPNQHDYIVTVPGQGYRFVAEVRELPANGVELVYRERTSVTVEEEEETAGDGETLRRGDTENLRTSRRPPALLSPLPANSSLSEQKKSRQKLLIAGGLLSVLFMGGLLAAGVGLWRFISKTRNPDRPAIGLLAQPTISQLTSNGNVSSAVISPDGKFYAFTVGETGESRHSLWLGQINGSYEILLRPAEEVFYNGLAFSSDSKTLYYGQGGKLYKIPVLGGVPEKILDRVGTFLSLSPGDRQIAFSGASKDKSASTLVVANLDGTGEREVLTRPLDRPFSANFPAWSPDGSMLAVGAASEDGKSEIFVVHVADGSIKQLTALAWDNLAGPLWQKDGQGLIAVAREKGAIFDQIWQIDYPSGDARRISRDQDTYGSAISVSADSNLLLAVQGRAESNIWAGPADDLAKSRQVTFGSIGAVYGWNGLDWTRDGKILFTGKKSERRVIYVTDADGGNLRQLTPANSFDQKLSVTADGRFIVFQSDRSGQREIWRANADGSDLQQLTTGGGNSFPHTTPDGVWVVYASYRESRSSIWRVPLAGGEPVRLTDKDSAYPRVSPDGKLIACTYRVDDNHRAQIALIPVEGGSPVRFFDIPSSAFFQDGIRWTPYGKSVCYRDRYNGIWKQDIRGGDPQRLAGLPKGRILAYGWSPDGKQFAFSTGVESRDVVLIRNFR